MGEHVLDVEFAGRLSAIDSSSFLLNWELEETKATDWPSGASDLIRMVKRP